MVILQTLQCLRLHSDEFVNNRQIKKIMALLTKTTRNYIHDWRRHFRDSQLSPLEYVSEASALLQLKIGSSFVVHEMKHGNRRTRPPHYALVLSSSCKQHKSVMAGLGDCNVRQALPTEGIIAVAVLRIYWPHLLSGA
jgi:hypothetical protein